ncbi:substrate-binding domain-containing protein, partial [Cellulomonas sp. P22]|uniref:substrate-binding domain-containing protein n=1 Tax=Cellulomonas sp. P22 TaxID=3373189 RepID=UPI0037A89DEC
MNTISAGSGNGTIGYVEYSYALNKDYPVVKVLNAAGYYVEPTAGNVAVALTAAQIDQDTSSKNYLTQILDGVYTNPDPRAYPLSSYAYMIIPTGAGDARLTTAKRQSLVGLAAHGLCAGQQHAATYGYAPLPLNLVQAGFDRLAELKTADPAVDLAALDLATCDNPTFDPTDLTRNVLVESTPAPAACDAVGAGPCGPGIRLDLGVPRDANLPGALTLVVPAGGIDLAGSRDAGGTRLSATAALPAFQVVDSRRDDLLTSWQVNAQMSDFTGTAGTVSAAYLGWKPSAPVSLREEGSDLAAAAGATVSSQLDSASSRGLRESRMLAQASTPGRGSTVLGGVIALAAPSSTHEGSYIGTLTVTLVMS